MDARTLNAAFHAKPDELADLMDRISLAIEHNRVRPADLPIARAALRWVVGYRHVHGRPCLLARDGWTSPIELGPGFASVRPCPECGVIHHKRGKHGRQTPLR